MYPYTEIELVEKDCLFRVGPFILAAPSTQADMNVPSSVSDVSSSAMV